MGNEVYANGREICCKAGEGKSICAFPDVCLTPPTPPAGPIPIPYPNTGMASDTSDGSKTVKISGDEIILKDQSSFKQSVGDEAATKSQGMSVITATIQGKVFFNSWSMDVKFDGENVVRHMDLTTHNHACRPGATPTWPFLDRMAMSTGIGECTIDIQRAHDNCVVDKHGNVKCPKRTGSMSKAKNAQKYALAVENDPCQRAARCLLVPWNKKKCCPPQTPHHLIPKAQFFRNKYGGTKMNKKFKYNARKAPCVCAEGGKSTGTHGLLHDAQAKDINKRFAGKKTWKCSDAVDNAVNAMLEVAPYCDSECIRKQLEREHADMGIDPGDDLRITKEEPRDISAFKAEWQALQNSLPGVAAASSTV